MTQKYKLMMHRRYLTILLIIILSVTSCKKMDSTFKRFIVPGGITYPGKVTSPEAYPGHNRVKIVWLRGTDPTVSKARIFWNNYSDSVDVSIPATGDTISTIIDSLPEMPYSFMIKTYDEKGNPSVPVEVLSKVYGGKYVASLANRLVKGASLLNDSLILTWYNPDTINVRTEVKYTSVSNKLKTIYLPADSSNLIIPDWKLPTKIYYRSSYMPQKNAIDTFEVPHYDTVIISNLPVDKSMWKTALLPNDAVVNAFGTSLSNIWDGHPGAYPDIYHTDGASMPHTFTIDLGKIYNHLTEFEEWGRTDCSCHNPYDFEIWGIADTTGAEIALPPTDPGWKDASIAKGWTMLTEVKRGDDGIAGFKVNLIANPPPVRYIRIRVLHSVDNSKFSHMSEISFWYNP